MQCVGFVRFRKKAPASGLRERALFDTLTICEPQGAVAIAQSISYYDIYKATKVVGERSLELLLILGFASSASDYNSYLNMYYAGALSITAAALITSASAFSPSNPPTLPPPTLPPTLTPLFTLTTTAGDIQAPIPELLGGYRASKSAYAHLQLF